MLQIQSLLKRKLPPQVTSVPLNSVTRVASPIMKRVSTASVGREVREVKEVKEVVAKEAGAVVVIVITSRKTSTKTSLRMITKKVVTRNLRIRKSPLSKSTRNAEEAAVAIVVIVATVAIVVIVATAEIVLNVVVVEVVVAVVVTSDATTNTKVVSVTTMTLTAKDRRKVVRMAVKRLSTAR